MATSKVNTAPKLFCFVLMPFKDEFKDVYDIGIREACKKAGAYCQRLDEQDFMENIPDRVFNQIAKADVIIADMSEKNPNVFYEVGYAHALNKPTILLRKDEGDIEFYLKHSPLITYDRTNLGSLQLKLRKRVAHLVKNPPSSGDRQQVDIDAYLVDGRKMLNLETEKRDVSRIWPDSEITVTFSFHNGSTLMLHGSEFAYAVLVPADANISPQYSVAVDDSVERFTPDGKAIVMQSQNANLLPNAIRTWSVRFIRKQRNGRWLPIKDIPVVVRVYTKLGSRDYCFTVSEAFEQNPLS